MNEITIYEILKKIISYYKIILSIFFISFFSLYFYFSNKEPTFKANLNLQENFIIKNETLANIVYLQGYFTNQDVNMIPWFDSNTVFSFTNFVKFITNENIKSKIILDFFEKNKIENNYENIQNYRTNLEFKIDSRLDRVTNIGLEFLINDPLLAKDFLEFFLFTSNKSYLEQSVLIILQSKEHNY